MKKNIFLKRFASLCLVLLFILTNVNVIYANDSLFDMQSLGIMEKIGTKQVGEYATRAEFAQMVVNLMQYNDAAERAKIQDCFTDIGNSPYKSAINLLYSLGYISGDGNGCFYPDDYITYAAACKILVYALGYDAIVSDKTLSQFMFVAGDIGVTKNIDSSGIGLTYGQLKVIFFNVLDIPMMMPVYFDDGSILTYQIDESKTFRYYMENKNGAGTVKRTGIVTADASTFMYMPANIKETQIQIDGSTYNFVGVAPRGYVGQKVDFYVSTDTNREDIIISIAPHTKNEIHNFSFEEVAEISKDEIKYINDDGTNKIKLDYATRYIYNNRLDLNYNISALKKENNYVIRTIDNNEDTVADLVFVYKYTDCIVESVFDDTQTIVLKEGYKLGSQKNIQLDEEKTDYEIFTPEGILTDFSAIEEDGVISIASGADGEIIRIVVGLPKIEGVITAKEDDYITLDNTAYLCNDDELLESARLGTQVTGYMNFMNILVAYEEIKSVQMYGYVYQYSKTSGSSWGEYKVKMLLPEYVTVKVTEGEADALSGETVKSKSLYVRNKDVSVYTVADKVMFNGRKISADAALQQVIDTPVSYAFDTNGKISKFESLEAVDSAQINADPVFGTMLNTKKYNATELLFGGGKGSPFAIEENKTLAFCVPKYQEPNQTKELLSDEDLKVFVELMNDVGYEVNGYVENEDTHVTDVLVVQRVMKSGQLGAVMGTSKVGMVTRVSRALDDDGVTERTYIKMYTDGKEQTFEVSDLLYNVSSFSKIGSGDLIAYTLDGFDCVNAAIILQEYKNYYDFMESEKICGEIKDIDYDEISNGKIRRVHNVDVGFASDDTVLQTLEILVKNPAPIFVIENDAIRVGNVNDLKIGDRVFAVLNVDTLRAIVIKR